MSETKDFGVEKKSPNKVEAKDFDLAVWLAESVSLAKAVENARKFLNRGRTAAETSIAFVGQGIGIIRNLKSACFNDRKAGASLKKEARTQIEQLIRRLSDVVLDLTDGRGRKYSDILAHYRASELSDDKTLAQEFENYRAEYVKNPTNGAICNRYGWMLHDCLKAAYARLHNAKLVEFFKKEFEAWHYQGPDKLRDANLDKCRERDIKCAEAFLNGPREALVLLSAGEWAKAKRSAEAYLISNPGNAAALEVVLKACEKSTAFDDMVAMVKAASAAIKWHPSEFSFQHWFVKAIDKKIGSIFALVPSADQEQRVQLASGGCAELIRQCCSDFQFLNLLKPGTWDYSRILSVVVAASESIFKQRLMLKGLLAELAPKVIAFARAWGLNNFRAADKEVPFAGRRRYSLAGRTILVLLKYCEYGVAKEDIEWTLHVTEDQQYLFRRDPTGFLNATASLYHAYGNEEESRRFAIDLVRCNQSEGWRWTVLARTYPKGSQERFDCMARSKWQHEPKDKVFNNVKLSLDLMPNRDVDGKLIAQVYAEYDSEGKKVWHCAGLRVKYIEYDDRGAMICHKFDIDERNEKLIHWLANQASAQRWDVTAKPKVTTNGEILSKEFKVFLGKTIYYTAMELKPVGGFHQKSVGQDVLVKFDLGREEDAKVQELQSLEDHEAVKQRTELLIQGERLKLPGVVLTVIKDKVSQREMFRVWWRDPKEGTPCTDFINISSVPEIPNPVIGLPVTVSVVEIGNRKKVVAVSLRPEGEEWDVYPFCDAVVIVKNEARHFMKIMYGFGKTCSADSRKNGNLSQLKVGDFCQVAVWEREDQPSVALDVKYVTGIRPCLNFCREYNGMLQRVKGSRDGIVGDVLVPPEARGSVYFETQVSGLVVISGSADNPKWRAVTCKPFKDLEVLQ